MWCRNVRNQLSAFLDGELPAAEARLVAEHLACCAQCEREHDSLKQLVGMTASIPMEEVSRSLHDRIMMRLAYADLGEAPVAAPRQPRRIAGSLWGWAAFAGAAAVAFGITRAQTLPTPQARPSGPDRVASSRALDPAPAETVRPNEVAEPRDRMLNDAGTAAERKDSRAQRIASTGNSAPEAAVADKQPASQAVAAPRRAKRAERAERPVRMPEAVNEELRPQPVITSPGAGKSITEPRPSEPVEMMAAMGKDELKAMPDAATPDGDETEVPALPEKEPVRMAGMAIDVETPDQDEGVRPLRMFLEERNRTIPQPPVGPGRDRKRKSL